MDDPEHGTVARVCLYLSPTSPALEKTSVAQRCDPRDMAKFGDTMLIRLLTRDAVLPAGLSVERITEIVKGSEVDRM
jgi:hypothetical protein